MKYTYQNCNGLLIADTAIRNDLRCTYRWDINVTKSVIQTVYGYKVYFTFEKLGVKHVKLTVTDNETGLSSVHEDDLYITQRAWKKSGKAYQLFDMNDFTWDAFRMGLFGEGPQNLNGESWDIGVLQPEVTVFPTNFIGDPLTIADVTFRARLTFSPPVVTVTGYYDVVINPDGTLPNDPPEDSTGYPITVRSSVNYNAIESNIYATITQLVNGKEIRTLNKKQLLGTVAWNNPFSYARFYNTNLSEIDSIYCWFGKSPSTVKYVINTVSDLHFTQTPFPILTITKSNPAQETIALFSTGTSPVALIFDPVGINYYYTVTITCVNNTNVPSILSYITYVFETVKGVFANTQYLTILQMPRNLVTLLHTETITLTENNDAGGKIMQFAKQVGKVCKVEVTGLPTKISWWDYSIAISQIHSDGTYYYDQYDQYYAGSKTIIYSTEQTTNTNEVAIVFKAANNHLPLTFYVVVSYIDALIPVVTITEINLIGGFTPSGTCTATFRVTSTWFNDLAPLPLLSIGFTPGLHGSTIAARNMGGGIYEYDVQYAMNPLNDFNMAPTATSIDSLGLMATTVVGNYAIPNPPSPYLVFTTTPVNSVVLDAGNSITLRWVVRCDHPNTGPLTLADFTINPGTNGSIVGLTAFLEAANQTSYNLDISYAMSTTAFTPTLTVVCNDNYALADSNTLSDSTSFIVPPLLVVTATLSNTDPTSLHRAQPAKTYSFTATSGDHLIITQVATNNYDTYMYLDNASHTTIAFDDDGYGGGNSKIDVILSYTGTYFVECSAYGTGRGTFTLTVTKV